MKRCSFKLCVPFIFLFSIAFTIKLMNCPGHKKFYSQLNFLFWPIIQITMLSFRLQCNGLDILVDIIFFVDYLLSNIDRSYPFVC